MKKNKITFALGAFLALAAIVSAPFALAMESMDHGSGAAAPEPASLADVIKSKIEALQAQVQKLMTVKDGSIDMSGMADCKLERDLGDGLRGEDVKCLQELLVKNGWLSSATGYYGNLTKEAVKEWQKRHGLPITGFFGKLSREKFGFAAAPMAMDSHAKTLAVSGVPNPTVVLKIEKDTMDGWNLHLETTNFKFTPEKINTDPVQGEGHAHLYVDGWKVGRLYGEWQHVPKSVLKVLKPGRHEIKVTLNANNHNAWAVGEKEVSSVQYFEVQ